jgi:hypothetical protein
MPWWSAAASGKPRGNGKRKGAGTAILRFVLEFTCRQFKPQLRIAFLLFLLSALKRIGGTHGVPIPSRPVLTAQALDSGSPASVSSPRPARQPDNQNGFLRSFAYSGASGNSMAKLGCFPHARQSLGHALPALSRVRVRLTCVLLDRRPFLLTLRQRSSVFVRMIHRYCTVV